MSSVTPQLRAAANDAVARTVTAVGLAGIALIHLLDLPGKFSEVPYLGVMYLGAIGAGLVLAGCLTRTSDSRVWAASGGLAAAILVGFLLSRTTGLPAATGDIGNWSEPLGMASLFVEGSVALLSAGVLAERHVVPAVSNAPYARPTEGRVGTR
jgi:hypothetical protein